MLNKKLNANGILKEFDIKIHIKDTLIFLLK